MEDHQYDDIIFQPHHQSKNHRHMSLNNRAAQFAPYDALAGYSDSIRETARLTDGQQSLGEDQREILERRLQWITANIDSHPTVSCTCYVPDEHKSGGFYTVVSGAVKSYDALQQRLILYDADMIHNGMAIFISDITDLSCSIFETEPEYE